MNAQFTDGPSAHLFERLLARDHPGIGSAGRTKLLHHGERRPYAYVLLHGLTASPAQFVRFADDLFARGNNVLVPRLPHHGHADRLTTALAGLTDEELRTAARESVAIARSLGDRVVVAGFSLGGLLAVWIAQHERITRAVAIAPFLGVSWVPNRWMGGLARLALQLPNRHIWWDPVLRERQMPEHGYPRYASHALAHTYRLAEEVIATAETGPLLSDKLTLVANDREAAVNNRAVRALAARMRSHPGGDVELVELRGLPISHDIIEPLRHPELAERVYPQLLALMEGSKTA